jgi:hypothetical protein
VQRIRLLDAHDVEAALNEVRAEMERAGKTVGSWWISDWSTPADAHDVLLERGLRIVDGDYDIGALALVQEPPAPTHDVAVRRVTTLDDFIAAKEANWDAFGAPAERRTTRAQLADEFELMQGADGSAYYAAWIGGRIVASGRAFFGPRGALLSGGATIAEARGRGAYRALVRARWDDAVARGTPALVVQAGRFSEPILRRLGFVEACRFRRLEDILDAA